MKLRNTITVLALLVTTFVNAQTADEVINKHLEAIGGKEVIGKIKSQVIDADLSVMGTTLPSTTTVVAGKGFRNDANFNGTDIIMVVTPTSGWTVNPLAGMTEPQVMPEDQVKAAQSGLEIGGDLFNYNEKGSKVELAGNEKIDGINTIKLKLTTKDATTITYFLDPATYYILKRESSAKVNGQELKAVASFSNYKKTDIGFVMPFSSVTNQGFEMTMTVNKVQFNTEVDEKVFEMPKK